MDRKLKDRLMKSCFILPLIWFISYIGLVVVGGLAAMYGASDKFYCTVYCKIGAISIIVITGIYISYQTAKYIRSCRKEITE